MSEKKWDNERPNDRPANIPNIGQLSLQLDWAWLGLAGLGWAGSGLSSAIIKFQTYHQW